MIKYKNKKIIIMGLGNYEKGSGVSAAKFLARSGAKITITDLKTEKELSPQLKQLKKFSNIKYALGQHRKNDFLNADFIVKNPSVPKNSFYLKIAKKNKIPIINDWTIYFERRPDNLLVGVTGTKGKSTTASLIYYILKNAGKAAVLCGNIGQSPLAILNKIKKDTIVVAELSSWALQQFSRSPHISILTNLMADHLDKYKNLKEYHNDKKNIFKFQNKNDYLIAGKDLKKFTGSAQSKKIYTNNPAGEAGKILKIPRTIINKAIKTFPGIPGRLQFIKAKNGIKYYNDTCATMPDATIYALKQLGKNKPRSKIILIAGGMDKKLDYKKLAREIPKHCKALILFKGTASEKILKLLDSKHALNIHKNINAMKYAARTAENFAKKGDVILLSPAAASFNLFKNELDRGKQFVKAVNFLLK